MIQLAMSLLHCSAIVVMKVNDSVFFFFEESDSVSVTTNYSCMCPGLWILIYITKICCTHKKFPFACYLLFISLYV